MYIRYRYNKNGDLIEDPAKYDPVDTEDLVEFLNQVAQKYAMLIAASPS